MNLVLEKCRANFVYTYKRLHAFNTHMHRSAHSPFNGFSIYLTPIKTIINNKRTIN